MSDRMHAKMVKSISLEDNGDIKRGDTVWMIANGNVKVNKDKPNTVELVYVDLE